MPCFTEKIRDTTLGKPTLGVILDLVKRAKTCYALRDNSDTTLGELALGVILDLV